MKCCPGSSVVTRHCSAVAVQRDLVLLREADFRAVQRVALRDLDLAAHDIDAGDHFGDRVLHLDARIHFDEEPLVAIDVDQELDRAGVVVLRRARESHGGFGQFCADALGQADCRGDFDDFLMAALHGAIALIEMQHVAVLVAEDLNFDVLGAAYVALEKDGRIAESGTRFLACFGELGFQFARGFHDAHTAPAAAVCGFDDQRKSDALRDCFQISRVRIYSALRFRAPPECRLAARVCVRLFCPQGFEQGGAGTDESDPGLFTSPG